MTSLMKRGEPALRQEYRNREDDGMMVRNGEANANQVGGSYNSRTHQVPCVTFGMSKVFHMLGEIEAVQQ